MGMGVGGLKRNHLKREVEEGAQIEKRKIFSGSWWRQWGGGLDKYTPPLLNDRHPPPSHLPPGEKERAKQGWTCHLNPSSLLILHDSSPLHPSASFPAQAEGPPS